MPDFAVCLRAVYVDCLLTSLPTRQIGSTVRLREGQSYSYDYQLQTYTCTHETDEAFMVKDVIKSNGITRVSFVRSSVHSCLTDFTLSQHYKVTFEGVNGKREAQILATALEQC